MPSPKQKQLARRLSLSWLCLLTSCATIPDKPACTAFPAADFPAMRETFYRLCARDPVCNVNYASWMQKIQTWSYPSDHGYCITLVSGKGQDVDATHPLVVGDSSTVSWKDVANSGVLLPAKATFAPLKTYLQVECHNSGQCGSVGNWQSTLNTLDAKVSAQ